MNKNTNFESRREFLKSMGLGIAALGTSSILSAGKTKTLAKVFSDELCPQYKDGKYIAKDFMYLTKNSKLGLSSKIIENHIGLYNGYVNKVNSAEEKMSKNQIDEASLKDLAFSLNGMTLHEIYFSSMTDEKTKRSGSLNTALEETFGTYENYLSNLVDIAMKVKGWSLTCLNLLNGKVFNYGEDTHSSNFPVFAVPVLALDVYDHAFTMDFGDSEESKKKYIETFKSIIDWDVVSKRFALAKKLA
jgi:Fe-Mn family superoxide dismutase